MNAVTKLEERQPAVIGASSMMEIVARAASDPGTDVAKLERLMAMAERIQARDAGRAFDAAMADAQEEMGPVRTDANNPQTRSQYATYAALDRALRPIYTKHGFAISYDTGESAAPDMLRVLAYVSHKDGDRRTYKIDMPADGKGAKGGDVMTKTHATGSAFTYGQRYLVKGIFNIVVSDKDDDGNKAATNGAKITPAQVRIILDLIERFHADIEKFCIYYKIEAVPDLPAKEFDRAVANLNLKGKTK